MAGKITRAITRETAVVDNMGHTLMIRLASPFRLEMWEKGRRSKYSITWGEVWGLIVRNRLAEARKAIAMEKKERKRRRVASQ